MSDNKNLYQSFIQKSRLDDEYLETNLKSKQTINSLKNVIEECQSQIAFGDDFEQVSNDYKAKFSTLTKQIENQFFRNLPEEKKQLLMREVHLYYLIQNNVQISRFYDQEQLAQKLKAKIRRVLNWRLEELKRDTRENKFNLSLTLFQQLLFQNKQNKDLFEMFKGIQLLSEIRTAIWQIQLENLPIQKEYQNQMAKDRVLTISKFDHDILKDTEEFIAKLVKVSDFDAGMVLCLKTILSYYERKTNRLLSDYLFFIGIPLVYAFNQKKFMHKNPVELISYFFTIQNIVEEFDLLVDKCIQWNEEYDAENTDIFMNSLAQVDEEITNLIISLLHLEEESQRHLLVLLVKKFVHSLGFQFLSLDNTLFLWDQIFLKIKRSRQEIYLAMAISMKCIKTLLLRAQTWDDFLQIYFNNSKDIVTQEYITNYNEVFSQLQFYIPTYPFANTNLKADLTMLEQEETVNKYSVQNMMYKVKPPLKPRFEQIKPQFARIEGEEHLQQDLTLLDAEDRRNIQKNIYIDQQMSPKKMGLVPDFSKDQETNLDILEGL